MPQFSLGRRGLQPSAYRVRFAFVLLVLSQSSRLRMNRFGPRLEAIRTTSLRCMM